jgi:hypothetical protein
LEKHIQTWQDPESLYAALSPEILRATIRPSELGLKTWDDGELPKTWSILPGWQPNKFKLCAFIVWMARRHKDSQRMLDAIAIAREAKYESSMERFLRGIK